MQVCLTNNDGGNLQMSISIQLHNVAVLYRSDTRITAFHIQNRDIQNYDGHHNKHLTIQHHLTPSNIIAIIAMCCFTFTSVTCHSHPSYFLNCIYR